MGHLSASPRLAAHQSGRAIRGGESFRLKPLKTAQTINLCAATSLRRGVNQKALAELSRLFPGPVPSYGRFHLTNCGPARDIVGSWYLKYARHGFLVGFANN